jgi:hypothetical protein
MATEQYKIVKPELVIKCRECELEGNKPLQVGTIINGELVYYQDHHGRPHPVRIDVGWLKRVLAA